jgi:pyruvate dehydrogenase E1 component alpha subunit
MHLIDLEAGYLGSTPIVGGTIPIAAGTAFASWMRGEGRVSVVFFGEAAIEEGIFHEAANFAALKKLPIVFVCENNLYSVYSSLSVRQPEGRPVYKVAEGLGLKSRQGDGNEALEVFRLAEEAVQNAKEGKGPTFLEFMTYRWREHCGPYYDNDLGYRTPREFEEWKSRCPIERVKNRLLKEGALNPQELDRLVQRIEIEIQEAILFAETSPFPDPEVLQEHIYA